MDSIKLKIALCSKALETNQTSHDPRIQTYFKTEYGAIISTVSQPGKIEPASGRTVEFLNSMKQAMSVNFPGIADIKSKLNSFAPSGNSLDGSILCLTDHEAYFHINGDSKVLLIRNNKISDLTAKYKEGTREIKHYLKDVFIVCNDILLDAVGGAYILEIINQNDPANCCSKILKKANEVSPSNRYAIQIVNVLSGDIPPVVSERPVVIIDEEEESPKEITPKKVALKPVPPEIIENQNPPMPRKSNSKSGFEKNKILYGVIILLLFVLLIVIVMNIFKSKDEVIITDAEDTTQLITDGETTIADEGTVNESFITNILRGIYRGKGVNETEVRKHVENASFSYRGSRSPNISTFNIANFSSNIDRNNLRFEKLESLRKEGENYKAVYTIDFNGVKNKFEMLFSEGADGKINVRSILYSGRADGEEEPPTEVTTETTPPRDTSRVTTPTTTREQELQRQLDTVKNLPTPRPVTTEDTTRRSITPTPKPSEEKPEQNNGNNNNGE